jgi:hypothetical protein
MEVEMFLLGAEQEVLVEMLEMVELLVLVILPMEILKNMEVHHSLQVLVVVVVGNQHRYR